MPRLIWPTVPAFSKPRQPAGFFFVQTCDPLKVKQNQSPMETLIALWPVRKLDYAAPQQKI
ncbi:MAG: hypothetical protein AB1586_32485 [Pseudomonadota bacterium]